MSRALYSGDFRGASEDSYHLNSWKFFQKLLAQCCFVKKN